MTEHATEIALVITTACTMLAGFAIMAAGYANLTSAQVAGIIVLTLTLPPIGVLYATYAAIAGQSERAKHIEARISGIERYLRSR
jgi:hypothetical protein